MIKKLVGLGLQTTSYGFESCPRLWAIFELSHLGLAIFELALLIQNRRDSADAVITP